jgi:hypothetical protein
MTDTEVAAMERSKKGGRRGYLPLTGFSALFLPAAVALVLTAGPSLGEPGGVRLDCKAGYNALLKEMKERQDLQMDDYPFGMEFHKKDSGSTAYYFTKPVHAAHPAIFWYGGGKACQTVKADGCGYGATDKFKSALEKYRARGCR